MGLISRKGIFVLPLFHATSHFFADLIMQDGLGKTNIVESWRLVDLASDFVKLVKENRSESSVATKNDLDLDLLSRMANQEITAGGFNFRHGAVYLSASRPAVMRYADNSKGSELLTAIDTAIASLPSSAKDEASHILRMYPEAESALASEHQPVIITAHDVPISSLRGEGDMEAQEIIETAERLSGDLGRLHDVALQICSFELIECLPTEQISVEHLNHFDTRQGDQLP